MKILRFWFAVICYSGIIFYVSSIPSLDTPVKIPHFDKVFHFSEYFPYGYLVAIAFADSWSRLSRGSLFKLVLLFCFLYAASDEFHQSFVEGRSCDIVDWLTDAIAVTLASYIYLFHQRKEN